MKYMQSEEYKKLKKEWHDTNLPLLKILKDKIDSGKLKVKRETWVNNDIWDFKWADCTGVECQYKTMSTKHECPLKPTKEGCWWIYAHLWRKEYERKSHRTSITRKVSDI